MPRTDAAEAESQRRGGREPRGYRNLVQPGSGEFLAEHHLHKSLRQVGINNDPRVPATRTYRQPNHHGPTRNALPPGVKPQKCRFWPHCIKDDCNFVHPSRLCLHFPNCRHGEACLFIHPACAYGPTCSRRNCQFSHSHFARPAPLPSRRHLAVAEQRRLAEEAEAQRAKSFKPRKDKEKEEHREKEDRREKDERRDKEERRENRREKEERREKEHREAKKEEKDSKKEDKDSKKEKKKKSPTPHPSGDEDEE